MVKLIGYIILGISILIWLLIPVFPFLSFSVGKIAGITTGLIVAGEITLYLNIFLIGKEFLFFHPKHRQRPRWASFCHD
jgi:hypothetical protein